MSLEDRRLANIGFTGNDPDDLEFACMLQAQLAGVASSVRLIDIDALERSHSPRDHAARGGVHIYVISRGLISSRSRREALAASSALQRNVADFFVAYVCRGFTAPELKDRTKVEFPELRPLFGDVRIDDESTLSDLIEDVRTFLRTPAPHMRLGSRVGHLLAHVCSSAITTAGYAYPFCIWASIPATLTLWVSLVVTPMAHETHLAWFVTLCFGFALNRIPTLEMYPWLGRVISSSLNTRMEGLTAWAHFVTSVRNRTLVKLGVLGAPVLALVPYLSARDRMLTVEFLLIGCGWPILYYWATDFRRRMAFRFVGLRPEAGKHRNAHFPSPRRFDPVLARSSATVRRKWFCPPDRVFISYAWEDEKSRPVAHPLAQTLDSLAVRYFIDKRTSPRAVTNWRQHITNELLWCTHVFVVIGPEFLKGETATEEVRLAIERWETEVFPAVICVVDSKVAAMLQASPDSSVAVKTVLKNCVHLRPGQVANARAVSAAVASHRFQGLARDWQTLLWPRSWLLRTPGVRSLTDAQVVFRSLNLWMETTIVVAFVLMLTALVGLLGDTRGDRVVDARAIVVSQPR